MANISGQMSNVVWANVVSLLFMYNLVENEETQSCATLGEVWIDIGPLLCRVSVSRAWYLRGHNSDTGGTELTLAPCR
jgi:hypothetical protein